MWTFLIIVVIGVVWWSFHKSYMQSGKWADRRRRSAWSWGLIGALIGSFFGVAGFGGAIAGTIPGAIVGYLIASNLMKRDYDDDAPQSVAPAPPAQQPEPSVQSRTHVERSAPIQPAAKPKRGYLYVGVLLLIGFVAWVHVASKQSPSPAAATSVALPAAPIAPLAPLAAQHKSNPTAAKSSAEVRKQKPDSGDLRSCLQLGSSDAIARCAQR